MRPNPALASGSLELLDLGPLNNKCLAYRRVLEGREILIYLDFSDDILNLPYLPGTTKLLFSTSADRTGLETASPDGGINLNPLEGLVLAIEL